MLFMLAARLFITFAIVVPMNFFKASDKRITEKEMTAIFFAGTMRGAIAFALALQINGEQRSVFSTTVLAIAIFTTIVFGAIAKPLLSALGLSPPDHDEDHGGSLEEQQPLLTDEPIEDDGEWEEEQECHPSMASTPRASKRAQARRARHVRHPLAQSCQLLPTGELEKESGVPTLPPSYRAIVAVSAASIRCRRGTALCNPIVFAC